MYGAVGARAINHSPPRDMDEVIERSTHLGRLTVTDNADSAQMKRVPIRMHQIDEDAVRDALNTIQPPPLDPLSPDQTAEEVNEILYACASNARRGEVNREDAQDATQNRWRTLLAENDSKLLWKAINWNGSIKDPTQREAPSDDAFKQHFELLLNPAHAQPIQSTPEDDIMYLPVTDDPIQPIEVSEAVKSLKPSKSGGPSGIPPGLLKLLPANWIIFLASLFTELLNSHRYPFSWSFTKLVTLFKKGARDACSNYRGISLMDSLAKTYDKVLNRRLSLWFIPDREQAGCQKKRGCLEHLLTLRLLIDYAKAKRQKLYIIFIDFSKAYDRVPRDLMIRRMKDLGCGSLMVQAISAIYSSTKMILRTALISTSIGIRQGSPTSCFLFTLVVNDLIRNLKTKTAPDGFLGWLHVLMLMDDAVILATNRQRALQKLNILTEFCASSGMIINEDKTQYMVVNGQDDDRQPLQLERLHIINCDVYTYLGTRFTQDAKITSAVKAQSTAKMPHVIKFEAFIRRNHDMPFELKKKVFSAALSSAILYGVETWLSPAAIDQAAPMYRSCVRSLLGVRKTTASDLCLVESGLPSLQEKAKAAQKKYILTLIRERNDMTDDPFAHVWRLTREANTPCARYINALVDFDEIQERNSRLDRVRISPRTKFITYRTLMNPLLEPHEMYNNPEIKEHERLTATRFRLCSHNLAIETGRWSRRPREDRLCPQCNSPQDENHALAECQINRDFRNSFPNIDFTLPNFFTLQPVTQVVHMCHELIKTFV